VLAVLLELNRTLGQTILMITHDAAAASIAHRVLHMRDGHLVEE
jgi:putative ABC transport system ATP-binding protein